MRKLLSLLALSLLLASCHSRQPLPQSTSAAAEIYNLYAQREDLTVALIGNYHIGDNNFNAVMLQANDESQWDSLFRELRLPQNINPKEEANKTNAMVIRVEADSNTLAHASGSSLGAKLMQQIGQIVDSLHLEEGNETEASASDGDPTSQDYTLEEFDSTKCNPLLIASRNYGKTGYIILADIENFTLWLFFYSTEEELFSIIDYAIREKWAPDDTTSAEGVSD